MSATYFGTSEESAQVPASELKPGVRVDPWHFGTDARPLIVDRVVKGDNGMIQVWAIRASSGREAATQFRPDRQITTWGTLGE